MELSGTYDWSPMEEYEPIQIYEHLCVCYGPNINPPEGSAFLRLHKHPIFGTGGHPATRLAVVSMVRLATSYWDGTIKGPFLEFGASTGLLALIAAMSGTEEVHYCSDSIESQALADDNGINNGYDITVSDAEAMFDLDNWYSPEREMQEPFLSVIACQVGGSRNSINYLPYLYEKLKSGGTLIWSGHTNNQHKIIQHQISEFFEIKTMIAQEDWPCIVASKSI